MTDETYVYFKQDVSNHHDLMGNLVAIFTCETFFFVQL